MDTKCAEHEEHAFFGDVWLRCVFPQVTSVHIHLLCDQPRVSFLKQWHHLHIKYIYICIVPKKLTVSMWPAMLKWRAFCNSFLQTTIYLYPFVSIGSSAPTCYIDSHLPNLVTWNQSKIRHNLLNDNSMRMRNLKQYGFVQHHNEMVFIPIL